MISLDASTQTGFVYLSIDDKKRQRQLNRLRSQLITAKKPEPLNAQAAVYVLVEYIKHPEASVAELSKAVEKREVKASPEAITMLFKEHDLKNIAVATTPSGTTILLSDIARIEDGLSEQSTVSRLSLSGNEPLNTVSLQIYKN